MSDWGADRVETDLDYAEAVGSRLRLRRRALGMSLADVEAASGREFKASVLGAYERGERMISVLRLQRLSEIYQINVDRLLPGPANETGPSGYQVHIPNDSHTPTPGHAVILQYARAIRAERAEKSSGAITLRSDDVLALARLLGQEAPEVAAHFANLTE